MIISAFKKIITGCILFATILILASCSSSRNTIAIEQGWELIGETKVNFVRDRDQIRVMSNNRYTAIRFRVEQKDIILKDLNIVYQNGDKLAPLIDEKIAANQNSRDIELGADGKYVSSIEFSFRSTGSLLKGRAKILVFGKRFEQPYYPVPIPVPVPVQQ
jgi:hypothetical protein